jgi:serine/threonine protein kinase/Flp pilus assembly protein TadD
MSAFVPNVGQLIGHYRIVESIGKGGMGVVYRAHDEQLDRDVALKILPPLENVSESSRRQFRREAVSVARINHTNVAMAFEFGQDHGVDFLVTEYVPGTTLDILLANHTLTGERVVELGQQLAEGLEAAHREGIIHRDLKPGNLRINPDGKLKILDFGLALLLSRNDEPAATVSMTNPWKMAGTLPYMAPEQLSGATLDARTDIWAAGAVLYQMATCRPPFGQVAGTQLIAAILHQTPTPVRVFNPEISPELERLILKALEKDPAQRFQSAAELKQALRSLSGVTVSSTAAVSKQTRSARWLKTAALALIVIAVFVLGVILFQRYNATGKIPESSVVAVLPFESVGNDAAMNALGLGLTDTVTAKLWQASSNTHLQMVSTREMVSQGVKNAEQARREFGSDFVLEGSIQQSGSMLRITYDLIDSKTHRPIAAGTVTGEANDIFGLQDRFVEQLLDTLPTVLNPTQRDALKSAHDTQPAAYDFYLRGRGYLEQYQNPENIDHAIHEFEEALKVDEKYAPAYAGLGRAYAIGFLQQNRGKDWLEKSRKNCSQALTVGPQLAEAHSCMGKVYFATGQYESAVEQFNRSLDLNHDSDETLGDLADAHQRLGNPAAAESAYRKAISLRPNYWGAYSALGTFYYNQARYKDAAEIFRRVTELAPDNYRGYSNLGGIYLLQGRYSDAVEALQKSIHLRPTGGSYGNLGATYFYMQRFEDAANSLQQAVALDDGDWLSWGSLGDALYWSRGKQEEAARAYRKAIDVANSKLEVNPRDAFTLAYTSDYYVMLGDKPKAISTLQKALALAPNDADVRFRAAILYNHIGDKEKTLEFLKKASNAGFSQNVIRDTPDFSPLRDDPRFRALIASPTA